MKTIVTLVAFAHNTKFGGAVLINTNKELCGLPNLILNDGINPDELIRKVAYVALGLCDNWPYNFIKHSWYYYNDCVYLVYLLYLQEAIPTNADGCKWINLPNQADQLTEFSRKVIIDSAHRRNF
jgi:hypothetical protein